MNGDETIITSIKTLEKESATVKKPYLTFLKGVRLGQIFPLNTGEIVIGRAPECDLYVDDNAISRRHFKIVMNKNHEVFLVDLGSTNGTYVNGMRAASVTLSDGDKIQLSQDTVIELTFMDDTQRVSEERLYSMGVMDPVLNIYNKRFFLERLKEEFAFAKRKGAKLSLIMFDIDHFKLLNDTYGHLAGDLVLQQIAKAVATCIRTDDVFARFGGEEFIILLRDADGHAAMDLGERIRKIVSALAIQYEGKSISITISLGVTTLIESSSDALHMVDEADKFLYHSKKEGRNRLSGPF
ncbi:MAG: hypothetical protein A3G32_08690 [Deltaproteobacteria bacterium RIFCSPLOWO2_12_FULL_40_28]|nr:MAG: hypothetical protein A3C45_01390 [Deltaproteobacteria bacterium RIFCSPHIGHO2_02_FULL_40_28]OGQ20981.1 MAG: hypothetical protein A3E27_04055 [Deltaproteobacteria bacterium RIFCSPHIGHO2_12_FULL_40_32]OGQ39382.1 MAG: hypothetical protein A3I69_05415 [Deltaproteobacteria bacterium RIFCSPLOWO2_02_FULL_40_36]OGQ54663.1 MAG: hypothetical protein A3G32_08690 [Deltaproteobacteria bacterium RIFCSPLOWO2_12_FULL_40_28]